MTLLSMLDRFEQAAVTYETSTDKADRDELHAARRAIMEAFEAPRFGPELREVWIFEPHAMFGSIDPDDGEPFPFGYISTAAHMPIFELRPVLAYPPEELRAKAELIVTAVNALTAAPQPSPAIMEREAELVKALTPFAAKYQAITPERHELDHGARHPDQMKDDEMAMLFVNIGDLRAARAAIHPSLEQE